MSNKEEIPTINLKLETKEVKSRVVKTDWTIVETPYMILSDKNRNRRIWTNSKKKIILYYLWRITRIEWFVKKYNKLPVIPEADDSTSTVQKPASKSGFCYIGEDRGFRSCIEVGEGETCMSGDIFPTEAICINPNLRE